MDKIRVTVVSGKESDAIAPVKDYLIDEGTTFDDLFNYLFKSGDLPRKPMIRAVNAGRQEIDCTKPIVDNAVIFLR